MARAIGIDLGTTNSLVAYVDERNRPQVVAVEDGRPLLPSVVHYGMDGRIEVGIAARRRALERPVDTILSVKRFMGRSPADLRPEDRGIYQFAQTDTTITLSVNNGKRSVSAIEVSAEILRVLKKRAMEHLGEPVGGCVITVPAYFDDAQRQATKDAGRLAGLEVLRLVNEPTAAALAYGLDKRSEGIFAVYDLGGGTFDVSILKLTKGVFEVLSTAGDTRLGGDDFDQAVAAWILDQARIAGPDMSGQTLRSVMTLAQRLREGLTYRDSLAVSAGIPGSGGVQANLTRSELEELIQPLVQRTTAACEQALRDAGLSQGSQKVDGVILVGGVTRTPLVRRHVRMIFGQEPLTDVDPDTVVAMGAAVQADALDKGGREDALLLDVIPLSLGVEMMGGVVEQIIPRNSTIPASATQQFTTYTDGQTGIVVHVLQGERELARDCRSLARFTLRGIPPMPAGLARVEITYAVDADGILSVSARELTTGIEQKVQVKPSYGLSEAEVERMLEEAFASYSEDVPARLLAEWRVEGERTLRAVDNALELDGELLSDPERAEVERCIAGLRRAMKDTDFMTVRAWIDAVNSEVEEFAERRMDKHIARAITGRRVDQLAGPAQPPRPLPNVNDEQS